MTRLESELAELERAVAELKRAIAAPLRELADTALAVLSTPRSLVPFLAMIALACLTGWMVAELVAAWST